jgi:transcriptional regulator with XRE-family HTH domain
MRLNVSRSLIAQYETGRKKADREFLEKIAASLSACTVEELERVSEEDLREAARASQQTIGQRFSENMTKEMLEAYRQNCIANGLDVICDFNGLSASFLSMMEKDLDLHISLEINADKRLEDYITYDEETMLISPWDVKEVVVTALRISRKTGGQNEVRIPVADYREFQNNITSICGLLYNTLEKQSGTVPDGQEGRVWRA